MKAWAAKAKNPFAKARGASHSCPFLFLYPMPPALKRLLLILLVFSPLLFTARLVQQKAVDVGCWDMWENALLMKKWHDGNLHWSDLYAPQIQHRIVIPRLLIIAMTTLSGGDFRWEQYLTFLIFVLDAWLLWRLLCATLGVSPWRWPLMFAMNLLVFCPIHYQILFWGSSMWGALPMPCLLAALLVMLKESWNPWLRLGLAALLAEFATHSFTHGILIWPVTLVFFLLQKSATPLRTRLMMAGVWLVVAGITIGCYFHDFRNTAYHAYDMKVGDSAFGQGPGGLSAKVIGFFFAFLGNWFARNPFADHPLEPAKTLGVITFALFLAAAALLTLTREGRSRWREALPWLALASYVLLIGCMVSAGRAQIGEHRAVTPRYLNVSEYLLIALLALAAVVGPVLRALARDRGVEGFRLAGVGLLSIFVTAQIPVWQYGLHLSDVWYQARRQAQALVLFLPYVTPANLNVLDKDSKQWNCLRDAIQPLWEMRLLKFHPLESADLKWFSQQRGALNKEKAEVTTARFREDGSVELSGNARFSIYQPVDAVLIAGGDGKVIALGQPLSRPLLRLYGVDFEFSNVEDIPVASMFPWKAVIHPEAVPDGAATLDLWGLDVSSRSIAPIRAQLLVDKAAKKVEIKVK